MERFPTYNARLLDLPRPSLYEFSPLAPSMADTGVNAPHHLSLAASTRSLALGRRNPTMFPGRTGEFFSSFPHLQKRLDELVCSSLGLEVVSAMRPRSALRQFPKPSACLSSNDGLMLSRLAAAQNPSIHQRQKSSHWLVDRVSISATSANPPNQWPLPVGLVSSSPIFHPRLRTGSTPSVSSTSALSCAATVAELILPFSKEEESRIPLVGGPESFPMVLHRVLAELELIGGDRGIATFLPDGRSFQIKNQALFASTVLPVFFPKMKSFASFQRQLNLYDFRRIGGAGLDRGAYRHESFVRDYPVISCRMRRIKIKGSHHRGPPRSPKKEAVSVATEATGFTSTVEASHKTA